MKKETRLILSKLYELEESVESIKKALKIKQSGKDNKQVVQLNSGYILDFDDNILSKLNPEISQDNIDIAFKILNAYDFLEKSFNNLPQQDQQLFTNTMDDRYKFGGFDFNSNDIHTNNIVSYIQYVFDYENRYVFLKLQSAAFNGYQPKTLAGADLNNHGSDTFGKLSWYNTITDRFEKAKKHKSCQHGYFYKMSLQDMFSVLSYYDDEIAKHLLVGSIFI